MRSPFLPLLMTSVCAAALLAQRPAAPPAAPTKAPVKAPAKAAAKPAARTTPPAAKKAAAQKAKPAPAPPAPGDPVVASAGALQITKSQFETFLAGLPEHLQAMTVGPARRNLVNQLLDVMQVAAEARSVKYDQDPKVHAQLAFQADQALANSYLNAEMKKAASDESVIRGFYDRNKSIYRQLHARHILIRVPGSAVPLREGQKELTDPEAFAKAQEIRKRILDKGDFEAIAKAESDDTGSGSRGGDLGFFSAGQMVAPFEQAAFALQVNQISEPVKTQFGYHIIQALEYKERSYEEVKAEIKEKSGPELRGKFLEELRRKNPPTLDEAYFAK